VAAAPAAAPTVQPTPAVKPVLVPKKVATAAPVAAPAAKKVVLGNPTPAAKKAKVVLGAPAPAPAPAPEPEVQEAATIDVEARVETVEAVEAEAVVETPQPTPAPAPAPMAVATHQRSGTFGGLFEDVADIDFRDLQLPRINLVQKSGQLADQFDPGDICFMKEVVLPQPLEFLLIGFRKTSFVEKVNEGEEGTICHSEAEVVTCGGTTEWTDHNATGKPLFQRYTTALVLIKAPDGVSEELLAQYFPYEIQGSNWALAAWSLKGPSYTAVVKPLKTARKFGYLRQGYHTRLHHLSSKLTAYKTGRSGYVPIVKVSQTEITEEFLTELTELMSSFSQSGEE
jgi:hypothetical protein